MLSYFSCNKIPDILIPDIIMTFFDILFLSRAVQLNMWHQNEQHTVDAPTDW